MKTTNHTKTTRTCKKMLALCAVLAVLLSAFVIPASAKSADGFQYYVMNSFEDDGDPFAIITGHKGKINGTLTVPAKLGGVNVWSIGDAAFLGRKDITKVVLPDSLSNIDRYAFSECTNLKTIVMGSVWIETGAFSGCKSLKTVKITAYKHDGYDPSWEWNETNNAPLFAADVVWTRYSDDLTGPQTATSTRTEVPLKLEAGDDIYEPGYAYYWYCPEGICEILDGDMWGESAGDTVRVKFLEEGECVIMCEAVNKKGEVIWEHEFDVSVRLSLATAARRAVTGSYLYGVAEYTVNDIRWKTADLLDRLGINV